MATERIDQQALLIRIAALEARQRRSLKLLVILMALVCAAFPFAALAAHQFTDVPSGHTFHSDIDRLYDARITTGCATAKYCPADPVTRGQMAGFLNRGLGRVGFEETGFIELVEPLQVIATRSIKAGNVTGGQAFLVIMAGINMFPIPNTGSCPCTGQFYLDIRNSRGQAPSFPSDSDTFYTFLGTSSSDVDSGTGLHVVGVPTGTTWVVRLIGTQVAGSMDTRVRATITVQYVPFSEDGDNILN